MQQHLKRLTTEGYSYLVHLVDNNYPESVDLEFKLQVNDEAVPKIYAKAASAFANTNGGVIIWGIDSRKNSQTGSKEAVSLKPIGRPHEFLEQVRKYDVNVCDPPIRGTNHIVFSEGYVATVIPKSLEGPHRSLFGEKQYFMRIGDKSISMPHRFVEQAILSRRSPSFKLRVDPNVISGGWDSSGHLYRLLFSIENSSPISAEDVIISLSSKNKFRHFSDHRPKVNFSNTSLGTFHDAFIPTPGILFHPGTKVSTRIEIYEQCKSEGITLYTRIFCKDSFQMFSFYLPGKLIMEFLDIPGGQEVVVEQVAPEGVQNFLNNNIAPTPIEIIQ